MKSNISDLNFENVKETKGLRLIQYSVLLSLYMDAAEF